MSKENPISAILQPDEAKVDSWSLTFMTPRVTTEHEIPTSSFRQAFGRNPVFLQFWTPARGTPG
jgi:hypothetical protein